MLDCFVDLFKEYSKIFTFFNKKSWIKFLADVAVKIDDVNIEGICGRVLNAYENKLRK